jgi:hypothetical protein
VRRLSAAALALGMICPLLAEGPAERFAQTTSLQRIDFAAGGTVRWNSSYGDLYIEGWDQPSVEIAVIKSTNFYERSEVEKNSARLETIGVAVNRRSDTDLEISTTLPKRKHRVPPMSSQTKNKVTMEYRIRLPRNSRLMIDHRGGMVTAGNVMGDIDVANRDGDIMLLLPEKGSYAIDARSKMGHIASDFDGKTLSRYLVGQRFVGTGPASARRIHLRTGFGGITILALPPEGEALSTADGEITGGRK